MTRYHDIRYNTALYMDLELTCWDTVPPPGMNSDIIEIGVVAMDLGSLEIVDEASYFASLGAGRSARFALNSQVSRMQI